MNRRRLVTLLAVLLPLAISARRPRLDVPAAMASLGEDDTCYVYLRDGRLDVYPARFVTSVDEHDGLVTLSLTHYVRQVYALTDIDTVTTTPPQRPSLRTFKFNDKYNDNLTADVEADTVGGLPTDLRLTVAAIGKRLTPSFTTTDTAARVWIGTAEQHSKLSRPRFDTTVTYTVGYPRWQQFDIVKVSDEVWSEPTDGTWTEVPLTPDDLATNAPSNFEETQGLAMMLDGDINTFFQSTWGTGPYTQKSENVVLDVHLPYALSTFKCTYRTRDLTNYSPLAFTIYASTDGSAWTPVATLDEGDGMPTYRAFSSYTSPAIDMGHPYTHLRFELTRAEHTKVQPDGFVLYYLALSEFRILESDGQPHESELITPAVYAPILRPYGRDYDVSVDFLTDHHEVPAIHIDIDGGESVTSRDYYLHARFHIDGQGVFDDLTDSVWIKGRGNTSWSGGNAKNPYRLKFDHKVGPFGLTKGRSWCLIAGAQKGSMMANAIGMKAARLVGTAGANHVLPVDLYINGEYRGSYTFTEKVGISNNSIDIDEASSVLLELDSYYDETYRFRSSPYNLPVNIKEPDLTDPLYADDAPRRFDIYRQEFNDFCAALQSGHHFEQFIDIDAFCRYYFVNELVNNMELCHPKSTYIYKEGILSPDARYVFGPVWDLDWAFGYENSRDYYHTHADVPLLFTKNANPGNYFFEALTTTSEAIAQQYYRTWHHFLRDHFDELLEYAQDYYDYAAPSLTRNATRWNDRTDYAAAVADIRTWLRARADYVMSGLTPYPLDDDDPALLFADVNADGYLSLADVVTLASHLRGTLRDDDIPLDRADINADGRATEADLVALVAYLAQHYRDEAAPFLPSAAVTFAAQPFEAHLGETSVVTVTLTTPADTDASAAYTALQFDIVLPEGLTLQRLTLVGCDATHRLADTVLPDGTHRCILYDPRGRRLTPGTDLLRLEVEPTDVVSARYRAITLAHGTAVTPAGDEQRLYAATIPFTLHTGLTPPVSTIRIEGGDRLTIHAIAPTPITVATPDGIVLHTFTVPEGLTHLDLPAGIYLVNHQKILIR